MMRWCTVDLGGREPDPGRRVHGFGHVPDELLDLGRDGAHWRGDLAQPGVGVLEDRQNGHRVSVRQDTGARGSVAPQSPPGGRLAPFGIPGLQNAD